jgi:hypothetical protein
MPQDAIRLIRVYIAGPYTAPDPAVNVRKAMEAAMQCIDDGLAPFVPHLSHFLHMHAPRDYETWMTLDFAWLEACDAVWRLPGPSAGADREVTLAQTYGIPVFTSYAELDAWRWK